MNNSAKSSGLETAASIEVQRKEAAAAAANLSAKGKGESILTVKGKPTASSSAKIAPGARAFPSLTIDLNSFTTFFSDRTMSAKGPVVKVKGSTANRGPATGAGEAKGSPRTGSPRSAGSVFVLATRPCHIFFFSIIS